MGHSILAALRRDIPVYLFVAGYALAALALALRFGIVRKFVPFTYVEGMILFLPCVPLLIVIFSGIESLFAPEPLRAFRAAFNRALLPRALAAAAMLIVIAVFMGVYASVKSMLTDIVPFYADPMLAKADAALHGGDPWRMLPLDPGLTGAIDVIYGIVWSSLLPLSLSLALLVPSLERYRTQYLWTALLIWPLLGNVLAGIFMSAGPAYYEAVTGSPRFAALAQFNAAHAPIASAAMDWLWLHYENGTAGNATGISAFPSLHLANATLLTLQLGRISRWLGLAAALFCAVILFGSVLLGWHYAVDGYFSIVATAFIWAAVGRFLRARRRHSAEAAGARCEPAPALR